ncbi:three-Cys-motif partner protein TcmP [Microbacterium sp. NPDC096154]|uniref:three-Cys-motif partner protein TcmP n=1 Tax=Microbacterium sp. NPDC096154 TaxID=3155549 RepID=UPI00331F92B6
MTRTDNQPTVWELSSHTAAKHDLLRHYLGAWFAILGSSTGRVVIIDGFAGPGVYANGEPGSPAIAVRTLLDHRYLDRLTGTEFVFVFNEEDQERFTRLTDVVTQLGTTGDPLPGNVRVELSNRPFAEMAQHIIEQLNGARMAPTFAFLDPFGISGVPIDLIRKLLASDRSELFIYFHQNGVNRFATAGNVDHHLDSLFGTDEYRQAPPAGDPDRVRFFHDLYARQLRDRAGFRYVRSFEMVNATGHTGHYLFFCTRHLTGLKKMKAAMWKIAPLGDYRFSDKAAGQNVLFEENPNLQPLGDTLRQHFAGNTVTVEQISDFVAEHTPYTDSQYKGPLKKLQQEGLISSDNQRRTGTFPPGTRVSFASAK